MSISNRNLPLLSQHPHIVTSSGQAALNLIDLIDDVIIAADRDGRITFWNKTAEALYGWSAAEALGASARDLLPTRPGPGTIFPESLNVVWRGELRRKNRAGEDICVESLWIPWHEPGGVNVGTICIDHDLTQKKKLEAALTQHQKLAAAGRLAATIAHEINNPLTSVVNLLHLLRTSPGLDREAQVYLKMADEQVQRAAAITRQMLTFHRESPQPVGVNLSQLLEGVLGLFSARQREVRLRVHTHYETAAIVQGFPGQLHQVFANLIGNAIDAGARTLHLRIAPWRWQQSLLGCRVVIADDGPGIARENLARIFEPFFTTKGEKGTGLGLWVVRGIIHKHGGHLRVRSRPQRGTCFAVFLPATVDDVAPHPRRRYGPRMQQLSFQILQDNKTA